jgi:hypothetical protein
MKMIGVFVDGDELVIEYPDKPEAYVEALQDALLATQESGIFHEVKRFEK